MITEVARLEIDPTQSKSFEEAIEQCVPIFQAAQGCLGMQLEREIEDRALYRLVVRWARLEDHTLTFRESAGFQQWRQAVGSFFIGSPVVVHTEIAVTGFQH